MERPAPDGTEPAPAGTEQVDVWWGYNDELESWSWDDDPGQPMTVHVCTSGDSITLLLNGATVADRSAAGRSPRSATRPPLRLVPDVAVLTTSRDALAHVLAEVTDPRAATSGMTGRSRCSARQSIRASSGSTLGLLVCVQRP